jgi:hypothetical protein
MKNDTKTKTPPNTKKARIALAITIAITILIAIWVAFYAWGSSSYSSPDVPRPLGDKLEYIGKEDYGCTGGLCDSGPSSTYYYATDMSIEEIESYFKKAATEHPSDRESSSTRIWLKTSSGKSFIVRYYDDKNTIVEKYNLTASQRKYVISLESTNYETARASL